jgi:hypothetical protein
MIPCLVRVKSIIIGIIQVHKVIGLHAKMKTKPALIIVLAVAPVILAGCDGVGKFFGGKSSPDEFTVYSRAPLSIPPEYKLRPPSPGAARPQEVEPRDRAKEVILGSSQQASTQGFLNRRGSNEGNSSVPSLRPVSPGEKALVLRSGGNKTDPEIRAIINRESIVPISGSKTIANKVLFWRSTRNQISIIDPGKENKRIRDKQKKGKPITSDGVPVIDQDLDRGFLETLFFE